MSDVARQAGVSRATASYVLNRTPGARIPEQTRAKVLAAAEALRYVPHVSARSLRRGRSDLVVGHVDGSAIMSDRLPFFGLVQVASEVRKAGYTFLIHGDPTVSGLAAARAWLALRPAAVVATLDRFTEESVAMLAEAGTVPVALGRRSSELTATVVLDDGELGRAAAGRLADRGCRRIAVLGSHEDLAADQVVGNRIAEALAAARERGLEAHHVPMRPQVDAAARVVDGWLRDGLPDGVVGPTDRHAGLLLGALTDAGVDVPGRVAVIGMDDDPFCDLLRPRLTSVRADLTGGDTPLAGVVLAAIEGRWDPGDAVRRFPAHVVVRDSA
ncbi:LacI family DNA-binding transcriptional regulator [Pseudonocardia yuanmonensis]|uniref:LacI family DNA-binding transcriptional regulator n=1 Tax=Pseudonocardia yuanmonensis TaxID=1095914 RepID=A0ABP8X048_9PSEU